MRQHLTGLQSAPKQNADAVLPKGRKPMFSTTDKVIALGASTGGTEAIKHILMQMPPDCPGIVVTQHMPPGFTRSFSERLDQLCAISVKEASNGDRIRSGQALIARGDRHLTVRRSGAMYYADLKKGPPVNRHIPSVNVLFRSVAQNAGRNTVAALLTGMGNDGAEGLLEIKQAGGRTIAQDEATAVVFGMPKEATELGAADRVMSLSQIAATMAALGKGQRVPASQRQK